MLSGKCQRGSSRVSIHIVSYSLWLQLSERFHFPVANVPDVETQYHAHEFLDATVQPKPIEISPNEVYSVHRVLSEHLDYLVSIRLTSL
jgi:hypothetical protein